MHSTLVVFDVDYTIADLFLESVFFTVFPKEIQQFKWDQCMKGNWAKNVNQSVFNEYTFKIEAIESFLSKIPVVNGIKQLLEFLDQRKAEIIIISAGVRILIKDFLELNNLDKYIKQICARQIEFKDGKFHYQTGSLTKCENIHCDPQFCKGEHLDKVIRNKAYSQIIYIGDGENDICPVSRYPHCKSFIRQFYSFHYNFTNQPSLQSLLVDRVKFWRDARQIIQFLENSEN